MSLTYSDILKAVNFGRAGGRWYILPRLTRALIYASLSYTRGGRFIKSPYAVEALAPLINFLMGSKDSDIDVSSVEAAPATHYKPQEGAPTLEGDAAQELRRMVLVALEKLRRRPDAARRVPRLTRAFLKAVVRAPVKFVNRALLSTIIKSLKIVNEALSPRVRLIKMGLTTAWGASMTAYRWGNKEALGWRRDDGFAIYWGAMIQNWPKSMQAPPTMI